MPDFQATPGELALVQKIFAHAQDALGLPTRDALPGQCAIEIFNDCGLSPETLGDIWGIADADNHGFLSPNELAVALRLMGWAQSGEKVEKANVNRSGPLPTIKRINDTEMDTEVDQAEKDLPLPPFSHSDGRVCKRLFEEAGPVENLISGESARDIFIKSNLPPIDLWNIWNLADTKARGALDIVDFALGMYLIHGLCAKKVSRLPSTIPQSLYEEITSVMKSISSSPPDPAVASDNPPSATNETTTQVVIRSPSPTTLGRKAFSDSKGDYTHSTIDITSQHQELADQYFLLLDTTKAGTIETEIAAGFMMGSMLQPDVLGDIWNTVPFNDSKYLTRSEFATIFHLIRRKLVAINIPSNGSPKSSHHKDTPNAPLSPPPSPTIVTSPRPRQKIVAPDPPPKDRKPSTSKTTIPPRHSATPLNTSLRSGAVHLKPPREKTPQSAHHAPKESNASPILPARIRERQDLGSLPKRDLRRASAPTLAPEVVSDPFSDHDTSVIIMKKSHSGQDQGGLDLGHLKPPMRTLRSSESHSVEDDGIFYELRRRNELLETTITRLMSQLKSHTDSSQLLLRRDREAFAQEQESLTRENETMKRQIFDMEQSMSQLLTATTEHTEGLVKKIDNLSSQVIELEQCQNRLQGASALAQEMSQENDELRRNIEEMKTKDLLSARSIETLNTEKVQLKEEVEHLRSRALEMRDIISRPTRSGENPRELRLLMNDLTKENESLKQRLRNMEQSTAEILLANNNQTHEDLVRENRRLTQLLQSAERNISVSAGQHAEVSTRAEGLARENADLKRRLRELQESSTGRRTLIRRGDVQRQVEQLTQENRRLAQQLQQINTPTPSTALDAEVAPPAYDEIPRTSRT